MRENQLEKSKMSTVADFVSNSLQHRIAPPGTAPSVKERITIAARKMGWKRTRTRDAWYGDTRIKISIEELKAIELKTGVEYGRAELRTVDELISKAETLMDSQDADFHGPFVAALRSFLGLVSGS